MKLISCLIMIDPRVRVTGQLAKIESCFSFELWRDPVCEYILDRKKEGCLRNFVLFSATKCEEFKKWNLLWWLMSLRNKLDRSIYVNLEGQNHRNEEQIRGCRGLGTVGRMWRREMAVGEDWLCVLPVGWLHESTHVIKWHRHRHTHTF